MPGRPGTIWGVARIAVALAAVSAAHFAVYRAWLQDSSPAAALVQTVSVELTEPEQSAFLAEEMARLEEMKKLHQQKQAEIENERARLEQERKQLMEEVEKIKEAASSSTGMNEDVKKREEAAQRLEEQFKKAADEAKKREEMIELENKQLTKQREEAKTEREQIENRQKELADLARTLVDQQRELAASAQKVEQDKAAAEEKEKAAEDLAKLLLDRQKDIEIKQKALEDSQREFNDTQAARERELTRIADEWKKIESQKKALEDRLSSAESTASTLAAAKAEWQKLEAERQKLEAEKKAVEAARSEVTEAREVRENIEQFKKHFDRAAYDRGLAALKASVSKDALKDGYVPFDFKFLNDKELSDHLRYFGIVDLYWNKSAKKFFIMEDYSLGVFSREGEIAAPFLHEIADKYSFAIKRSQSFYAKYSRIAEGKTGKGVEVLGLIPLSMSYEILYHKKKMLETGAITERELAFFRIAPWLDQGSGRWMFKIVEVGRTDGSVIKVGNYHFQ